MLLDIEESDLRLLGFALQVATTAVAHAKDTTADGEELSQKKRVDLIHSFRSLEERIVTKLEEEGD